MYKRLSDFFFPRICHICGGRLSLGESHLCVECFSQLPYTAFTDYRHNSLSDLFELQIPIRRANALVRYIPETPGANMVKSIKYHYGRKLANYMGTLMAECDGMFGDVDTIVPVPLTRSRKRQRGYNQAEEIAKGIASVTGLPIDTDSVKRTRYNGSQTMLKGAERWENVRGCFKCVHPERLRGKHILLVDDVVTTGATMLSLAQSIMEEADGVSFSVFSLCITGEMRYK
ncbi:MAG: ComF family protein [Bacteroidaceae bacterium]|nr:ComF family protein [Bacteroidaceae bacterium]